MLLSSKIDNLITKVTDLKPSAQANEPSNVYKFEEILKSSLAQVELPEFQNENGKNFKENLDVEKAWLDNDYPLASESHRKPNMREMIEAISGQSMEDLYANPDPSVWKKYSKQASEILYGVIGARRDTRDWQQIMTSDTIVKTSEAETRKLHGSTKVDLNSEMSSSGKIISQYMVIKDESDNILRTLQGSKSSIIDTLNNFGVTPKFVPANLDKKIVTPSFDRNVLKIVEEFASNSVLGQATSEYLSITEKPVSRVDQVIIPKNEYEKL